MIVYSSAQLRDSSGLVPSSLIEPMGKLGYIPQLGNRSVQIGFRE
jgi:hypothetical protein